MLDFSKVNNTGAKNMKKILIIILIILLSGCGKANANHKSITIDDETIWNLYHVNMEVFSERFIEELTDDSQFFRMKPSISINSRTEFHGSLLYFEVTENSKPFEFSNKPKRPIDQFPLEIDTLRFEVRINSTTTSPDKNYPWIYITGSNGKLNYYILLELGNNNEVLTNQYSDSDVFKNEDKIRIIELISSIFSRNPN
jgi:hypothetical protein